MKYFIKKQGLAGHLRMQKLPVYGHVSDLPGSETETVKFPREGAVYVNESSKFRLSRREFKAQYNHIYAQRADQFMSSKSNSNIRQDARNKWSKLYPAALEVDDILHVQPDVLCYIVGTLYKDMPMKPNILDEYHAREHYMPPPKEKDKYTSPKDSLKLEDRTGRVPLLGNIPIENLTTGIVLGLLGRQNSDGAFVVEDHCFPSYLPQRELSRGGDNAKESYVALISGLHVGKQSNDKLLPLQLFVDWVTGQLCYTADQHLASRVVRVIIAGDLIEETLHFGQAEEAAFKKTKLTLADTCEHIQELDFILAQLAASVPVDIMPGQTDPTDSIIPQQPLHRCLFPSSHQYTSLQGVCNPYKFTLAGNSFLGTAGQNVSDVYRFTTSHDRLATHENIFTWRHLFPTAPDTLGCFPFTDTDPLIIEECPHVLFAGNQPSFAAKLVQGPLGQVTQIINIPRFDLTGVVVLVNLQTLECFPLNFGTGLQTPVAVVKTDEKKGFQQVERDPNDTAFEMDGDSGGED